MATQDSEFDLKAKPEEGNGDIVMGNGDIVMGIVGIVMGNGDIMMGIVGIVNFRRALLTL